MMRSVLIIASTVLMFGAERKLHGSKIMFGRFNVRVQNNVIYSQTECITNTAKTYCSKCEKMIGWMITGVPRENMFIKEGRFCMRLDKLTYSNHLPLVRLVPENQFFQANEENADQDGGSDEDYDDNIPDYMMHLFKLNDYLVTDHTVDQVVGDGNEQNALPPNGTIHCLTFGCRMQVASSNDYILMSRSRGIGLFNSVINVDVPDNVSNHLGTTVVNIYCSQCHKMIGWKIIAVTQPSKYITEGRFCMRLDKLGFSDDEQLICPIEEENVRVNEENTDQYGDATEGYGDSTEEEMRANIEQNKNISNYLMHLLRREQGGGGNEQNHDQNVDQGGGANEQNVDQGGGANEQNVDQGGGANEQNVDQHGGSNELNVGQDGGGNEQNADQHGGGNKQNVGQDGGSNEKNADEHGGSNELNVGQDGGANEQNADQHGGSNEQIVGQDGGSPMKRPKI
ncbi:uncharacterized protein LOC125872379 [Solanum stenotomum]|uniref:uncharacterized protein LOC125872379 n=1 Tax=Solanum stenotomum TaxID=172797 RepID=UPI0020CFF450|nr:uncharacterized protein LOC125872379 [Solanum stenotomum]